MKILSYEIMRPLIKLTTDYAPRPTFVYKMDWFKNVVEIEAEIEKSIAKQEKIEEYDNTNEVQIIADLKDKNIPMTGAVE